MAAPSVVEVLETPDSRTTTQTLTTSAGTAGGDTLLIFYGSDFYLMSEMPEATSTAGALVPVTTLDMGANTGHLKVYTVEVASAGAKTVTIPAHRDCDVHGVVLRIPGGLTVDTVPAGLSSTTSATAGHLAPSVTTAGPDRLLVCVWLTPDSGSFSGEPYVVPGAMTKRAETGAPPFSAMAVATEPVPTAGATGTRTATWTSARPYGGISLAVAGAGPDVVTAGAVLTATSSLVAAGTRAVLASPLTLTATAALTATGTRLVHSGPIALAATAGMVTAGDRVVRASAALDQTTTLTAGAAVNVRAALAFTASSALTIAGAVLQAPIRLEASASLAAVCQVIVKGRMTLSGAGSLDVVSTSGPDDFIGRVQGFILPEGAVRSTTGGGS